MALEPGGRAPYTTVSAATTALDAWRGDGAGRTLGVPITAEVLNRAGVSESIAPRTLRSMIELELIDENGNPTPTFAAFRQTRGDEEYRAALQDWLRDLYADVLTYADPSTDSLDRVQEAFRTYEPAGQRKAMAGLLVGLWRYAGLETADGDNTPRRPAPRRTTPRPRTPRQTSPPSRAPEQHVSGLPPSLVGMLRDMPEPGSSWTSERRDAFFEAFKATVNFLVRVDDSPDEEVDRTGGGGSP